MKKLFYSIAIGSIFFITTSCSKDGNTGPDGNGGGGRGNLPFIEYKIGSNASVRVDCSEISFEAKPNETVAGVVATSASTRASFSFAFPAKTTEINKLGPGSYLIKRFDGTIHSEPFHLSLRAPKTPGGTDYYISIAGTGAFKNEVKSIEKSSSGGKQTSWVSGEFNLEAKNAAGDVQPIMGTYKFKLLTLD